MLWSAFQDTADRLARGAEEGDWRSAISRTYYAVFHFFREFFLTHGVDVGRGGQSPGRTHHEVIENQGLMESTSKNAPLDKY
jgi:uncharacterized protein (UPF0332 family)